jgi:hypothetical protein
MIDAMTSVSMMLDSSLAAASLSDRQQEVVDAPIGSRQLVLGGAGTGKTHVLIERIRRLIEENDVAPGSEILVLSFTRAVVRELKSRLGLTEGAARLVQPVTFDSFATRLLSELPAGEVPREWRDGSYDDRVSTATSAMVKGGEVYAILRTYRHVFVDEIQDLVGVRADMVVELLRHFDGFTVLGDPAQAIYEYQVRDDHRATTSAQFLERLRGIYPDLSIVVLDQDFRATHRLSTHVAEIGRILRDPRIDDQRACAPMAETLALLDHVDSFDDLAVALRGAHERTAVLCRTNAECLRVSELLFDAGVDHRLQHEATERVLPAWLAMLFRGEERTKWSVTRLTQLVDRRTDEGATLPDPETVVRFLTDAVGDDAVDLTILRERLLWGRMPDHIHDSEQTPIVISTVHRAKGLEFDRVFFGAPRNGVPPDLAPDELRVLYVALSRTKDDLWTFKAPNTALWSKPENADDRWVKSPWGERWKTLGWEIRPGDVDNMRPPGTGLAHADVAAVQDRLAAGTRRGARVDLRLVHVRDSEIPIPFYAVIADDEVIGQTDEHFGEALHRRLRRKSGVSFPTAMSNAFLVGVETVAGSIAEGEAYDLGSSGLWLRPRIAGLAHVQWYVE